MLTSMRTAAGREFRSSSSSCLGGRAVGFALGWSGRRLVPEMSKEGLRDTWYVCHAPLLSRSDVCQLVLRPCGINVWSCIFSKFGDHAREHIVVRCWMRDPLSYRRRRTRVKHHIHDKDSSWLCGLAGKVWRFRFISVLFVLSSSLQILHYFSLAMFCSSVSETRIFFLHHGERVSLTYPSENSCSVCPFSSPFSFFPLSVRIFLADEFEGNFISLFRVL